MYNVLEGGLRMVILTGVYLRVVSPMRFARCCIVRSKLVLLLLHNSMHSSNISLALHDH